MRAETVSRRVGSEEDMKSGEEPPSYREARGQPSHEPGEAGHHMQSLPVRGQPRSSSLSIAICSLFASVLIIIIRFCLFS